MLMINHSTSSAHAFFMPSSLYCVNMIYTTVLQLVDMFLAEQWLTYTNQYRTSSEYADVPPKIVYTLLYK